MKTLLTLFFLLFSPFAVANEHDTAAKGAIAHKCSFVISSIEKATEITANENITIEDYVSASIIGFLSGINFWYKEEYGTYKNIGNDEDDFIFAYIMNECKKNPEKSMMEIVMMYLTTLPDIK